MREKYESLVLVQLRELAKVRGLKVTSSMKKADLVEAMLAEDERVKAQEAEESAKSQKTETAADGQEAQQAGESAPEPARKRNAVTNKRTAASQQKSPHKYFFNIERISPEALSFALGLPLTIAIFIFTSIPKHHKLLISSLR